jgi:hypothetical protein
MDKNRVMLTEEMLVEWGTIRGKTRKLKKAANKLSKLHSIYNQSAREIGADSDLLADKRSMVIKQADNYREKKENLKKAQEKKDQHIVNKLLNSKSYLKKTNIPTLSDNVKRLYREQLNKKKAGQTLDSSGSNVDEIANKYVTVTESHITSIYFNRPLLSESFNYKNIKESYTTKELLSFLQESVINLDILKEEQIMNFVEHLGLEYIEEGKKWSKVATGVGLAALAASGAFGVKALDSAKEAQGHHFQQAKYEDISDERESDIAKYDADKLAEYDAGSLTPEKKAEYEASAAESQKEKDAADQAAKDYKAKKNESKLSAAKRAAGATGSASLAGAIALSKKKKKDKKDAHTNALLSDKNRELKKKDEELEDLRRRIHDSMDRVDREDRER